MTILLSVILLLFSTDSALAQWVRIDTIRYTALFANGDTIIGGYKNVLDPKIRISTNGGISWLNAVTTMQPGDRIEVLEKHKGNLYAGLRRDVLDTCSTCGGVYRSTDGGLTWLLSSTGIPLRSDILTLLDYGDTVFAGGSTLQVPSSLFVSTNGGLYWGNIRDTMLNYFAIVKLVSCGGRLFFAGGTGQSPRMWYSTNSGRSWFPGDNGLPSQPAVNDLACLGSRLYASVTGLTTGPGIYSTLHDSIRWVSVNAGLPGPNRGQFAASGSLLFLATSTQIYYLSNSADTVWTPWSSGLPSYNASVIAATNRNVYVSGLDGLWRRPISEVVSVIQTTFDLGSTSPPLDQNYPNPFNGITHVRFQVPTKQRVTLEVYDVVGRKIQTVVDATLERGTHEISLDATSLSSGVYVLRLLIENSITSKVMLLLK
jgi:hypothetical protein